MVATETCKCLAYIITVLDQGRFEPVCGNCGKAAPKDHPIRAQMERDREDLLKREAVLAAHRAEQEKADAKFKADAQARLAKLNSHGGRLIDVGITAVPRDGDAFINLHFVLPIKVSQDLGAELTRREAALGESTLEDFLKSNPAVADVRRRREQLGTLKADLATKAAELAEAEAAHLELVERGEVTPTSDKMRGKLERLRGTCADLERAVKHISGLIADGEKEAAAVYQDYLRRHDQEALTRQQAASDEVDRKWFAAALPLLPAMLLERLVIANMKLSPSDLAKRGTSKPLVIPSP
jgi:hypothetical protein